MRTRERLLALTQEVREVRHAAVTPREPAFEEIVAPLRQQLEALCDGRRLSEQAVANLEARLSEGFARFEADREQVAHATQQQASRSATASPNHAFSTETTAVASGQTAATGLRTPRWSPGRRLAEDGSSPTRRQRGDWVASLRFEPEKHGIAESPPEAGCGGFAAVSCGVHSSSTPWRHVMRQNAWQLPGASPPSPHTTFRGRADAWAASVSSPSRACRSPPPSSGRGVSPAVGPAAAVMVAAAVAQSALSGRSPSPPTGKRQALAPLQLSPVQQVPSRILFPSCDEREAHSSSNAPG